MAARLLVAGLVVLAGFGLTGSAPEVPTGTRFDPSLPPITPRPQQIFPNGTALAVPSEVRLRLSAEVDGPTRELVTSVLLGAGAVRVLPDGPEPAPDGVSLTVVAGPLADGAVAGALRAATGRVPGSLPAEGYALGSVTDAGRGSVVLAGADRDGIWYAAQTFRQLAGDRSITAVSIVDFPDAPERGVVEGFYGPPWSQAARLDQLDFYASVKLNSYMYAPKDDPYHRTEWRSLYPPDQLEELGELVGAARRNHVRFTFALSPGLSICYTDPDDFQALQAKLRSIYDLGVRRFVLALDDIEYRQWHCDGDPEEYGEPSPEAAARAQVDLLNRLRTDFLDVLHGIEAFAMVPTEYWGSTDSAYKTVIREDLDGRIGVLWTGNAVIPTRITAEDAAKAAAVFGRKLLLWDNYPVNDFDPNGRLLLGPYANREPGLPGELTGMLLNPMPRAAASKIGLLGGADFTWNDAGYDPGRSEQTAAERLAGGDRETLDAVLAFLDVEHIAPSSEGEPGLPQAPRLAERLAAFSSSWSDGAKDAALAGLEPYAELLAGARDRIEAGATDRDFVAECGPWLEGLSLWGQAFVRTLAGLRARLSGDEDAALAEFDEAQGLIEQAGEVRVVPEANTPVKVADGVLDEFLREAPSLS